MNDKMTKPADLSDEEWETCLKVGKWREEQDAEIEKYRAMGIDYKPILFGTVEQQVEATRRLHKMEKRYSRNEAIKGFFRKIFFTPLALAVKGVSVLSGVVAKIASLGLIGSAYFFYKVFCEMKAGVSIREIDALPKAIVLLLLPFFAYFISFGAKKLADYFEYLSL